MGKSRSQWTLAASLTICVALLVGGLAASAQAHHINGAAYTGTATGGGTVELDVAGDAVTRFQVNNVPGSSCTFTFAQDPNPNPIVNHAFSRTSGFLHSSGSFSSLQSVQGTFSITSPGTGCSTGTRSFTAATTASPAGTVECLSAQAAVDAAEKKVKKAKKKLRNAKTQRETRRAKKKLKKAKEELQAAQAQLAPSCGG